MTIYEMNQQRYACAPLMESKEEIDAIKFQITRFLSYYESSKYFMMLNNEEHYFTVFHNISGDIEELNDQIFDMIWEVSHGQVKDVYFNDKGQLEIWMNFKGDKDDCIMFLIFDYDWGIIEV